MFSQQISFGKCGYGVFLIIVSKTGLATNPFTLHKGINLFRIFPTEHNLKNCCPNLLSSVKSSESKVLSG